MTDEVVWTTREGRKIPVRGMTDSHLVNTIRMIRGNVRARLEQPTFQEILDEGYRALASVNGEMAQYAIEAELSALVFEPEWAVEQQAASALGRTVSDDFVDDVCARRGPRAFEALLAEAKRRGLKP